MWSRLGAPAIASSIGRTIASRNSDGGAPGYETLMLIVGKSTFGNCCCTSVARAQPPSSAMTARVTKTSGGRSTKIRVSRIIARRGLDRRRSRADRWSRRALPVGGDFVDVHGLRNDIDELVVGDGDGRMRIIEECGRRYPDALDRWERDARRYREPRLQLPVGIGEQHLHGEIRRTGRDLPQDRDDLSVIDP